MDFIDVLAMVWMFFNWVILAPIIIYYLYRFYAIEKKELVMQFRNKPIVYILNAMMLITLLGERFYANAVAVWSVVPLNWFYYFVFSVVWWSGFFLFLVKVFNLYYKQQYSMHIADMAWKTEINPDEKSKNWFIANKHTYGDPIYCAKLLAIPFAISCIINTIIAAIYGETLVLDFTQFFIASIPIIISFVIFYKSRKLDDVHKIRNETLYQCIVLMAALSFYLVVFLCAKIVDAKSHDPHAAETVHRVEWLLRNLVANLCAIGLALVPTAYPVYIYQSTHIEYKINIEISQTDLRVARQTETIMSITQVMSKYKSFKAFMEHLILEFNTEAMLFLVELIQIKHDYCGELSKTNKSSDEEMNEIDKEMLTEFQAQNEKIKKEISSVFYGAHNRSFTAMNIPTKVPKTQILGTQNSLREQMIALYVKYIKTGSDHELNLSSLRRHQLREIFESDEVQNGTAENEVQLNRKLIHSMDETAMEILLLLQDPFKRFKARNDINLMEMSVSETSRSIKTPTTP